MPAYRHAPYIEQAIRSVWAQTHDDVELIVIDDHSPDETFEIARALADEAPIPMQVLRNEQNRGVTVTLNRALALATGRWIAFLASDDWYMPEKLSRQLQELERLGDAYGCVHSDSFLVIDGEPPSGDTIYGRGALPPMRDDALSALAMGQANMVAITAMVRRDVLDAIGGFDEGLAAEDFDLHLGIAAQTRYAFIDAPLTCSRMLPGSLGKSPARYLSEIFAILDKHREALGEALYRQATRARVLHAWDICIAHEHWRGLPEVVTRGWQSSEGLTERLTLSQEFLTVLLIHTGRRHLASLLPEQARQQASSLYQRWLYMRQAHHG